MCERWGRERIICYVLRENTFWCTLLPKDGDRRGQSKKIWAIGSFTPLISIAALSKGNVHAVFILPVRFMAIANTTINYCPSMLYTSKNIKHQLTTDWELYEVKVTISCYSFEADTRTKSRQTIIRTMTTYVLTWTDKCHISRPFEHDRFECSLAKFKCKLTLQQVWQIFYLVTSILIDVNTRLEALAVLVQFDGVLISKFH